MARPKPINRNNEDLIGLTYRMPGALFSRVVTDISPDKEGDLFVASTCSGRDKGIESATVVRANLIGG